MKVAERLTQLGLMLPTQVEPLGNYVSYKRSGDVIYISGRGARDANGSVFRGKVGFDVKIEEAYVHARMIGLSLLGIANDAFGGLEQIEVLKVNGFVNAAANFEDHPRVINGCSDLLVEVLGEKGKHARSAVGMSSLPQNMTVEIEAIMRNNGSV